MTTTTTGVHEQLLDDLAGACADLDAARLRQAQKDTPTHRADVAACRERIDALLDLHLSLGGGPVLRPAPAGCR
ncbi:hypothetical protein ACI78V_18755 [Geodermatophilus sp. SYSU D00742]